MSQALDELAWRMEAGPGAAEAPADDSPAPWGGALYRTDFLFARPGRAPAAPLSFRRHTEALAAEAREMLLAGPDGEPGGRP